MKITGDPLFGLLKYLLCGMTSGFNYNLQISFLAVIGMTEAQPASIRTTTAKIILIIPLP
jgi:hypothetical protein